MISLAWHPAHSRAQAHGGRAGLAVTVALALAMAAPARGADLPVGFRETVAVAGLHRPTVVRFAPDGRVFVAQQDGRIVVLDGLDDSSPRLFADLRPAVDARWDRGLMGMAIDPAFPAAPFVYVLYSRPPPATGTPATARLSRLEDDGSGRAVREHVLIDGEWCQPSLSHAAGALAFAGDGSLYVASGDGAGWGEVDVGPDGDPCGNPPREGGALRSQDIRTPGDPAGLDGAILRVDPATGAGLRQAGGDPNAARIAAYGLRNPFRTAVRPGTDELWIGDAGWNAWEEVNRLSPAAAPQNFGWPCYEGAGRERAYDALDVDLCESLYGLGPEAVAAPAWAYPHGRSAIAGDPCPAHGGSVVSGLAFAPVDGPWPDAYAGGLFVADFSRRCVWVLPRGGDGAPAPALARSFMAGAAGPVDLQFGPGGDLFYVAYLEGEVRRVDYGEGNRPPVAAASATPATGPAPLEVRFDGSASSDPDPGDALRFAWDLDGDGAYDDGAAPTALRRYRTGETRVGLRVTDAYGHVATAAVPVSARDTPPEVVIVRPRIGARWRLGQEIAFRGRATDRQDGRLPAGALSWAVRLHRCAGRCHVRPLQAWDGTAAGAFVVRSRDARSWVELRATARDRGGLTATRSLRMRPRTARVVVKTRPAGLRVVLDGRVVRTPVARTVVSGASLTVRALEQRRGGRRHRFRRWSDGGPRRHRIRISRSRTLVAVHRPR